MDENKDALAVDLSTKRKIGDHRYTEVVVMDGPGPGNAPHEYRIQTKHREDLEEAGGRVLGEVNFQNGPIKEAGINGVMDENLISIVIDRLQGFQADHYNCRENALALTKLQEALLWLNKRTADRIARGVEGTHEV
jgi:hypothetical protein